MLQCLGSKIMHFLDEVKEIINKKIKPKNVILIDNSSLHSRHKSFDEKKFHLKIIIESEKLKKMNKIDAHKEIYSVLKNEMNSRIHALEIEVC